MKKSVLKVVLSLIGVIVVSVNQNAGESKETKSTRKNTYPAGGSFEKIDASLDKIIPANAIVERLAEGFISLQSALWHNNRLLVSDTGTNVIYQWTEKDGLKVFQRLRVYATNVTGLVGVTGLTKDRSGKIVLCHHGDRRILRIESSGRLISVAEYFNWRRFNGPYAITCKRNGDLYFTDAPFNFGEEDTGIASPMQEISFNGVYRVTKEGYVDLLSSRFKCPLGIAFSPDESVAYIANNDNQNPAILRVPIKKDGTFDRAEIFLDATQIAKNKKGRFGGIAVDKFGTVFAVVPGGVAVITKEGKHIGTITTDSQPTSCAFGDNGSILYITSKNSIYRIKTLTKGF